MRGQRTDSSAPISRSSLEGVLGHKVLGPLQDDTRLRRFLTKKGFGNIKCDIDAPYSPWIGSARDTDGEWVVKLVRSDQDYKHGEVEALNHFAASGRVPEIKALTEDGLLVAVKRVQAVDTERIAHSDELYQGFGKLAKDLHSVGSADFRTLDDILPTRYNPRLDGFSTSRDIENGHLITKKLLETPFTDLVAAHGDLNFRNVLQDQDQELWAIDAYGLLAPAALDLATPAAFTRDPRKTMETMLKGYGAESLPHQDILLAWSCIMACEQMKAKSEWNDNHQSIVDQFV